MAEDVADTKISPDAQRLARLQRRLERERAARAEAETIADRGMRELWLINRDLDRRVAERTTDLEQALNEVQVASSARDRLLRSFSHEVRTPLNGILGSLSLLEGYITDPNGEEYLKAAEVSADRLDEILRRLLTMVEAASGGLRLQLESIDLKELVDEVRQVWELKGMKQGYLVLVVYPFDACGPETGGPRKTILADRQRLRQIIDGLIKAIMTSSTSRVVNVEFSTPEDLLVIEVSTEADGVDIEAISSDTAFVGDEASVAMTSELVNAVGGTMQMTTDKTDRSTLRFVVSLPIQRRCDGNTPMEGAGFAEPGGADDSPKAVVDVSA